MSTDIKSRLNPLPQLDETERQAFEGKLTRAFSSADVRQLIGQTFERPQDHLDFLETAGGARKLREFYYEVILFDLLHGTNTSAYVPEEMFIEAAANLAAPEKAKEGVKHRSSLTFAIEESFNMATRIIRDRGLDPAEASLYDLGCGEGKAVLIGMSPKYPFKKAVGVDYSEELLEIARDNIAKFQPPLSERGGITFRYGDAAAFRHFNGLNVVYMYNPFGPGVMEEVEHNLRNYAGKTVLAYNKPEHAHLFSEEKGWKNEGGYTHADPDKRIKMFSYGFG